MCTQMSKLTKNFILVTFPSFTVVTRHQFLSKVSTNFLSGFSQFKAHHKPEIVELASYKLLILDIQNMSSLKHHQVVRLTLK